MTDSLTKIAIEVLAHLTWWQCARTSSLSCLEGDDVTKQLI